VGRVCILCFVLQIFLLVVIATHFVDFGRGIQLTVKFTSCFTAKCSVLVVCILTEEVNGIHSNRMFLRVLVSDSQVLVITKLCQLNLEADHTQRGSGVDKELRSLCLSRKDSKIQLFVVDED